MRELSVLAAADEAPDRLFLIDDARRLTFAEAATMLPARWAWLDAAGARAGEPVGVETGPTVDTALWLLALVERGLPFVPLHPRLTPVERARLIADAGVRVTIDAAPPPDVAAPRVTPPVPPDPESPLAIVYTSGSSGRPKGAVLSRRAFAASACASRANLGRQDDDRWLLALPPAHVGGLSILVRALVDRVAVVLRGAGAFDTTRLAAATVEHRVTLVSLVPTMLQRLLADGLELSPSVRVVLLGGAPAMPGLLPLAADRGVPVLTTYGLTEACSQVTTQPCGTVNRGELGAGQPLPGVEVRIREGRIAVRGPTLFSGYHPLGAPPSPFSADGFFDTGDEGRFDAAGNLHVLGRRSDLVVVGGENVRPAEVEEAAMALPEIAEACVFGIPDDEWGERVAMVVVGRHGPPDLDSVARALRTRLAAYKVPTRMAATDALPYLGIGKLDRRTAAERFTKSLRPVTTR